VLNLLEKLYQPFTAFHCFKWICTEMLVGWICGCALHQLMVVASFMQLSPNMEWKVQIHIM